MPVTVSPLHQTSGLAGYLSRIENYPKKCYQYDSSLNFSAPYQQFLNGINISMHLAFQFSSDTYITITLPGFTNKKGAFNLNPLLIIILKSKKSYNKKN